MPKQAHKANSIIMVRPVDFGFNEQTGMDNEFQHKPASSNEELSVRNTAIIEFENMVEQCNKAGLTVLVLEKADNTPAIPDAIFPNNWFSTTSGGRLFIYPMKTANRRAEVQVELLNKLFKLHGYNVKEVVDLRNSSHTQALEGTGSIIFHHPTSSIFAAISERCNRQALDHYAQRYHFNLYPFTSESKDGKPIYHTNVIMSCGERFAVIAEQTVIKNDESKTMINQLHQTFDDLIVISERQMAEHFCGNILQLVDKTGQALILMSESAYSGFTKTQLLRLEKHGSLLICPIPTIEYIGGGSARCMVAENFLPHI